MNRKHVKSFILNAFFILFTFTVMIPILYTLIISFSDTDSLYDGFSISFTLDNYIRLFRETDFVLWMVNTAIVSGITAFLSVSLTLVSAYTFSRVRFIGKKNLLMVFLLLQMFPSTLSMISIFKLLQALDLINTLTGLIFVYVGITLPSSIWILKGYFDSMPCCTEEAAVIDGASWPQLFVKIIMPIARPMLFVVIVYNFILCYSEFVFASFLLTGDKFYTIARGLRTFAEEGFGANWPVFAAGAVLGSLPIILFFYYVQDHFVNGFAASFGGDQ